MACASEKKEMVEKRNLNVDTKLLEHAFDADLHEFKTGEYPMSQLWTLLMVKLKSRGDAK